MVALRFDWCPRPFLPGFSCTVLATINSLNTHSSGDFTSNKIRRGPTGTLRAWYFAFVSFYSVILSASSVN